MWACNKRQTASIQLGAAKKILGPISPLTASLHVLEEQVGDPGTRLMFKFRSGTNV